jgi:hypothetical protein
MQARIVKRKGTPRPSVAIANKARIGVPRPDVAKSNTLRATEIRKNKLALPDKECPVCGERKPWDLFYKSNSHYDGRQSRCKACAKKYGNPLLLAKFDKMKEAVYNKLGNVCSRCGFSDKRALQIDHVYGGGIKAGGNRGTYYYKEILEDNNGKYQILCANCNWIKRAENGECLRRAV